MTTEQTKKKFEFPTAFTFLILIKVVIIPWSDLGIARIATLWFWLWRAASL